MDKKYNYFLVPISLSEISAQHVRCKQSVTWYAIRKRVKGRSIPLYLYLNQQALSLTVKMVGGRRSSYLHSVTSSLLDEKSLGQSSGVT